MRFFFVILSSVVTLLFVQASDHLGIPQKEVQAPASERAARALAEAYPDRVAEAALRDGVWAVRVDDVWFPVDDSLGLRFYPYAKGIPPPRTFDEETRKRIRDRVSGARAAPRNQRFLETVFSAATRAETERQLVTTQLLGRSVRIHRMAAEALARVDEGLVALAARDEEVAAFLDTIGQVHGYVYRNIAGTRNRSYHGYGLAVDILPKNLGGKQYYWRHIYRYDDEWFALPYEKRWMIPESVVAEFERRGFIWGGKWLFWDTVHFEYRPEILLFSGQKIERDNGSP